MEKLKNKVAVITGGGSGIGLSAAKEFVENGAKVVIFGRDKATLDSATKELGASSLAIQGSVTNSKDLDKLFSETNSKFGKIDVLFINVGQGKLSAVADTTEQLFDEMIAVNYKGAFFSLQKAVPFLKENSSVIITTSWINEIGFAGTSLLSGCKAALRSLVRVAGAELIGKGIRVNAVSPGAIGTPFWGKIGLPEADLAETAKALTNQVPLKRFGSPDEVAKAVLFLASDDSSYIVGSEISVDGGLNQL